VLPSVRNNDVPPFAAYPEHRLGPTPLSPQSCESGIVDELNDIT
jgi:hypothetical protein